MLLCNFCEKRYNCDYYPTDDECNFGDGHGDEDAVIEYAQEHGMTVSDAIALIKFCCGLR